MTAQPAGPGEPGQPPGPHEVAQAIANEMADAGLRLVTMLPETWLAALYDRLAADERFRLLPVAKEEEAVGIMAGSFFAGVPAVLFTSNSGFLTCACGINGLAMRSQIPMLLMIVQRGELDETEVLQGNIAGPTIGMIEALGMRYFRMRGFEDVPVIGRSWRLSYVLRQPVCVLMERASLLGPKASAYWFSEAYQRAAHSDEGDA